MLAIAACADDKGAGPETGCDATTTSVNATATVSGSNVVFSWEPRCAVVLVLVEEDADDMWGVSAPDLSGTATEASNIILPPVTYGQIPSGAEEIEPASPLVAGRTYELILWKIVPAGANVSCLSRLDNACLIAVKAFQR